MGVVNVTPDSFSDGGDFLDPEIAARHATTLLDEGADAIDVGGESTRPGSDPVAEEEERRRVVPVVRGILEARPEAVISVDTYRAATAEAALEVPVELRLGRLRSLLFLRQLVADGLELFLLLHDVIWKSDVGCYDKMSSCEWHAVREY